MGGLSWRRIRHNNGRRPANACSQIRCSSGCEGMVYVRTLSTSMWVLRALWPAVVFCARGIVSARKCAYVRCVLSCACGDVMCGVSVRA